MGHESHVWKIVFTACVLIAEMSPVVNLQSQFVNDSMLDGLVKRNRKASVQNFINNDLQLPLNNGKLKEIGNINSNGSDGEDSPNNVECQAFHNMNITDICSFVNQTADCDIDEGFIRYTSFVYCDFAEHLLPLGLVIVFIWWVFLFIGLAVTADDFFCPALTVISKTLGLSVTFLAFGNGAPDIFSSIAAIGNASNGDAGLALGALLGAGVFVTTVVAGVIAIVRPFDAMQRPFLRDVIFYLAAVFWTFYILWKKEITKYESIGFILLYVFYVVVVVAGRYIYQKQRGLPTPPVTVVTNQTISAIHNQEIIINDPNEEDSQSIDPNLSSVNTLLEDERRPLLNTEACKLTNYVQDTVSIEQEYIHPLARFFNSVNPIDHDKWVKAGCFVRFYEVFKCPVVFVLKLTIPVVDYEDEVNHNWSRHLNSLHCTVGPLFAIFATNLGWKTIGNVYPVWALVLPVGVILSLVVLFTSNNNQYPRYHAVFAYLGFLVSVIWIYCIANEVVNILQMFGIVFNISNAILGLTFLAWGNSIGDLIADTAMAKQGYPRMGISACFGGPLFNLLLGIGIPFTIGTFKNGGSYALNVTLEEIVLAGFLAFSLVSSLIIVPLSGFRMTRAWGIYLMVLYCVFLLVALLTETGVIHGRL
ncbi:hypothetical protein SNE40_001984 [Patella caerulea]|uniref:Sodium/calcium exchanger membrane region domain-containing protein n=1 Tax=Patella caerulea TaxID=87958 RepID=A0AAN8Q6Y1_PATCE